MDIIAKFGKGEKKMAFMDERMLLESQIGFVIGIMVGALGSWVAIIFFTDFEWYWKVFSSIGEVGIIGSLAMSLRAAILQRRAYLEVQKEIKKVRDLEADIYKNDERRLEDGEKNK